MSILHFRVKCIIPNVISISHQVLYFIIKRINQRIIEINIKNVNIKHIRESHLQLKIQSYSQM